MSCFTTGSLDKERGTNNYQPEEFRKSQKVTPCVQPPPRILLAGIPLGRAMGAPPGRTMSQNDRQKTTGKLIPSP